MFQVLFDSVALLQLMSPLTSRIPLDSVRQINLLRSKTKCRIIINRHKNAVKQTLVLEKKILKFPKCVFSLFRYYLPLEKSGALHLNKLDSPSPKDALCQVWLKLAQWFWRRRCKCEKFTDRRTTGDQKRSLELSAQVS